MTPSDLTFLPSVIQTPPQFNHPALNDSLDNEEENSERARISKLFAKEVSYWNYGRKLLNDDPKLEKLQKVLDDTQVAALAKRLTKIVTKYQFSLKEVDLLLTKKYLKVDAFIDDDKLLSLFEKILESTYSTYKTKQPHDSGHPQRFFLAKVISAAFDKDAIANKGAIVDIGHIRVLLRLKIKKEELYAIDLLKKDIIDEGSYMTAYEANDLIHLSTVVLKIPHENDLAHLMQVRNEKKTVKEIHKVLSEKSLPTDCVKSIPYAVYGMHFDKKTNTPIFTGKQMGLGVGIIEEKYRCTLFDLLEEQPDCQTRFKICRMLICSLIANHAANYAHGDLKLENILIKGFGDEIIAHIIDYGDAINKTGILSNEEAFRKQPLGAFSPHSSSFIDLCHEEEASKMKDLESVADQIVAYRQQRDVFSLGTIIASLLSGVEPYPIGKATYRDLESNGFPDVDNPQFTTRMKKIVPTETFVPLCDLISNMVAPSHRRMTATQALEAFDKIFKP